MSAVRGGELVDGIFPFGCEVCFGLKCVRDTSFSWEPNWNIKFAEDKRSFRKNLFWFHVSMKADIYSEKNHGSPETFAYMYLFDHSVRFGSYDATHAVWYVTAFLSNPSPEISCVFVTWGMLPRESVHNILYSKPKQEGTRSNMLSLIRWSFNLPLFLSLTHVCRRRKFVRARTQDDKHCRTALWSCSEIIV